MTSKKKMYVIPEYLLQQYKRRLELTDNPAVNALINAENDFRNGELQKLPLSQRKQRIAELLYRLRQAQEKYASVMQDGVVTASTDVGKPASVSHSASFTALAPVSKKIEHPHSDAQPGSFPRIVITPPEKSAAPAKSIPFDSLSAPVHHVPVTTAPRIIVTEPLEETATLTGSKSNSSLTIDQHTPNTAQNILTEDTSGPMQPEETSAAVVEEDVTATDPEQINQSLHVPSDAMEVDDAGTSRSMSIQVPSTKQKQLVAQSAHKEKRGPGRPKGSTEASQLTKNIRRLGGATNENPFSDFDPSAGLFQPYQLRSKSKPTDVKNKPPFILR